MSATVEKLQQIIQQKGLRHLSSRSLHFVSGPAIEGFEYFSSSRLGGYSQGEFSSFNVSWQAQENPAHVLANRQLLNQVLPSAPIYLKQVHQTDVFDADTLDVNFAIQASDEGAQTQETLPVADAAVTTKAHQVIAVLTADCLPVVLIAKQPQVIGVAHAGWRGLQQGVLEQTIRLMQHKGAQQIDYAWIGPAIGPDAFEVGAEVPEAFINTNPAFEQYFKAIPHKENKYLGDLPAIANHQLKTLGVQSVNLSKICTVQDADYFYSYRQQAQTGRLITAAYIKE